MVVMYSQYNYHQSNSNSSNQQPQQQQQTTSTANQVWNGQQWVSTNNATNQQQQSYAQAASAGTTQQGANGQGIVGGGSGGQGGMIIKHGKTHAELVQHYTSCKFYVCGCLDVYLRVCAGLCISCVHFFGNSSLVLTHLIPCLYKTQI